MLRPSLKPCAHFKRFLADQNGVVSIVAVMVTLLGLGLGVLTLDVGHLYLEKRRLQGAVDAAALAAAGDPANATTIAARVLTNNGYSQTAIVATGAYTADPTVPVASRINTDPSAQKNAVRITETISTPGYLASTLGGSMLSVITATATATQTPVISFAAGTGLASISNGQLNAVLGGLLGTTLSLSLVNYQALASTNVDALTFLDQLAAQAGVTAGTYGDLANTSITMGQMAAAIRTALTIHPSGNNNAAIDALNLIGLQAPPAASSATGNVLNTAVWQKRQIGSIVQQTPGQVTFNSFDLISAFARAYGSGHLVNIGSALSVPVTNSSVITRLSLGSPMASAALARVGTSIATAQTRLALTATVTNVNLGIASAAISLPLYLTLASGTATVAAIPCQSGGTMATLSAAAQAATVQFGVVSDSDLKNFSSNPVIQPATVVTISVLGIPVAITASGSLVVAAGAPANQNFTQADITAGTVKSTSGSAAGAIFSGLVPNMTLNTTLLSSGGLLTNTINNTLNATVLPLLRPVLVSLLSALDAPTDTLLRSLGLRLGVIDTVVHGVRCGTPTLVT
ncbi:MAG: pilus assembly protein TadG-related protein [Pseudomonadota bacterium]